MNFKSIRTLPDAGVSQFALWRRIKGMDPNPYEAPIETHCREPVLHHEQLQPPIKVLGLTIIEWIVVIATVGVVVGLLLPTVDGSKSNAPRHSAIQPTK